MAKQTTKKTSTKKEVVETPATPVMEHSCGCGKDCPCGCHKHGSMHIVKHIIVWAIIFALGMACGKMMNCPHRGKKMMPRRQPVFTNGCLDVKSIEFPKLQKDIIKADVNGDNCISIEEYKAFKRSNKMFRKEMRDGFKKPKAR